MKTRYIVSLIILLASGHTAVAQNQYNMSQYMLYQGFINPAAISNESAFNAALFHRSQWLGISGAPTTQGLSLNLPFQDAKNTVGLLVLHDKIGVNNSTQISAAYAYKLKLNPKLHWSFGLNAFVNIAQSNYNSLESDDVYDPSFANNTASIAMPNFKFGTYLRGSDFYAGFAIPNILENKIVGTNKGETKFNAQNMHYYLQGGYLFRIDPKHAIGLSTLIKQASGAPMQIDLNAQYIYQQKLGIGLSYRTSKELIAMINYQITPMFKLGYAYDYNLSRMSRYTSGSHEIMLIFGLVKDKAPVNFLSPRF
jgi:type IX secretion system PorP/SprF family membrane protein